MAFPPIQCEGCPLSLMHGLNHSAHMRKWSLNLIDPLDKRINGIP